MVPLGHVSSAYSEQPWFGLPSRMTPTDRSLDAVTRSESAVKKFPPFIFFEPPIHACGTNNFQLLNSFSSSFTSLLLVSIEASLRSRSLAETCKEFAHVNLKGMGRGGGNPRNHDTVDTMIPREGVIYDNDEYLTFEGRRLGEKWPSP